MTGDEIRKAFLQFFEGKGHTVISSSSLVPQDDPTLLLTSAGMVQVKPYFLGLAVPPNPRLASCQKCFRTSDVDSVGDNTHLTFFEMLGNFSVGDYFKKEAIDWAWEFVIQWLKLPPDRLWITVFLDDDAASAYWQETGVAVERIVRLGEEDNFWGPAGDSGPCGPCSEILYDFGEEFGCGKPDCGPACECDRFTEIWNLVFTQYDQNKEGKRTPLPKPNIDTGMGLERVAAVMQGKTSVYETDLFAPIVARIEALSGKKYGQDETVDRAMRIVAEHGRAVTFLIADGVVPSNEGRGYVLRRVLRRGSLVGRQLGIRGRFLDDVAPDVIAKMGHEYRNLVGDYARILGVIDKEERRFRQMVEDGLDLLPGIFDRMRQQGIRTVSGETAFHLYDTYGFPIEILEEEASKSGFGVDIHGFNRELEQQRERARAAHKFRLGDESIQALIEKLDIPPTHFVGYDNLSWGAQICALVVDGQSATTAFQGQEVQVILVETPFYGEMGGQVGDSGEIRSGSGRAIVRNTIRQHDRFIHQGRIVEGYLSVKDGVEAEVDMPRRLDIARNHTATHLLQAALRAVLGEHVRQSGSLVAPDRFRFDFTHLDAVKREQLLEIQHIVNDKIRQNLAVVARHVSYDEAISKGAIALFGEKYGDTVRMVETGDPPFSIELCGGTHVSSTGEIGLLHITAESSIGSGMRRIEAVTGREAERFIEQRLSTLEMVAQELDASPDTVQSKLSATLAELDREHKRAVSLELELARKQAESLKPKVERMSGVKVISARVSATTPEAMREMGDRLKERLGSGVIVLAAVYDNRPNFVAMVTPDLVAKGFHAGEIVKQVAKEAGGGGGGTAALGQGSGKDKSKLDEALGQVPKIIALHYDKASGTWRKNID